MELSRGPNRRRLHSLRERGISYIEVLVAVVILAVALAPALDALVGGLTGSATHRDYTIAEQRLRTRMEDVLAREFAALDAAAMAAGNNPGATIAAYSDAAGTSGRLLVTIYRYDGTAATATDKGLLWVKVWIEGSALALDTLRGRW